MNCYAGFLRQQENQQLGIPLMLAKTFEPGPQELAGFETSAVLMGYIDQQSPAQVLLGTEDGLLPVWDRVEA